MDSFSWLLLNGLFLASLLIVLAWLVQYSLAVVPSKSVGLGCQSRGEASGRLPFPLSHETQTRGVWCSLLSQRLGPDTKSGSEGVKGLIASLFSFKSFQEHWQRVWIQALNEQACRHGSSIQITFDGSVQLPNSATFDNVTCMDQTAQSMVLRCTCGINTITFPVTVTLQSPAAMSVESYLITIEPLQAQVVVRMKEVEEEGLLVTWCFSQQPSLSLQVSPRRLHRKENEAGVDLKMIEELVKDTIYNTQPAMILNLRACVSNPAFPKELPVKPLKQGSPMRRILVRQLRLTGLQRGKLKTMGEVCCTLNLNQPTEEKRTPFLPIPSSPQGCCDWTGNIALELAPDSKELRVKLLHHNTKGEHFFPGQALLALDPLHRSPSGQQVVAITQGSGLPPTAMVSLELLYQEATQSHCCIHSATPRHAVTPTKKVDVDRKIMPDGTIVTTVITTQSKPKLDHKLGESPSRSPAKVQVTEKGTKILSDAPQSRGIFGFIKRAGSPVSNGLDPVAETAIRQLTEFSSQAAKTPTKRSTLIISGVSKVPLTEDDHALSVGYAAAMDAALQGAPSPSGASNHSGSGQQKDGEETSPSDISEQPSVEDVESESGSTGALETRSLKDHKVGFLRSGSKLLFRRKVQNLSVSHEDITNAGKELAAAAPTTVCRHKMSSGFSRQLFKHLPFRSKPKSKPNARNGGPSAAGK